MSVTVYLKKVSFQPGFELHDRCGATNVQFVVVCSTLTGPMIENARFPNLSRDRRQAKSPFEAERRLCREGSEVHNVTRDDM